MAVATKIVIRLKYVIKPVCLPLAPKSCSLQFRLEKRKAEMSPNENAPERNLRVPICFMGLNKNLIFWISSPRQIDPEIVKTMNFGGFMGSLDSQGVTKTVIMTMHAGRYFSKLLAASSKFMS